MAYSLVSDLNSLFNSIYEDTLFVARESNIMTSLVTNYSARGWMSRYINTYPTITAETVGEGVDFANPTTWTKTNQATLTPGEIMCQVVLTDRRIETDPEDARRDASTEMGGAISTKIDTDLVGLFSSLNSDAGSGAGATLTLNDVAAGVSILRYNKIPNPLYCVLHPYGWFDIWNELGTPAATYAWQGDIANEALRSFYVGNWLAMSWFLSANIAISSSNSVGAIINPQALAFDTRKAPLMEPERDASLRAWELNLSAGYAYGVRRSTYGVYLTHDATTPT